MRAGIALDSWLQSIFPKQPRPAIWTVPAKRPAMQQPVILDN